MKWPYMIVAGMAVAGAILIGASQIAKISATKQELVVTKTSRFERSPAKLKKLIDTHRTFHGNIKITVANLVDELKLHLENDDVKKLKELTDDLLSQYINEIDKADKALQINDVFLLIIYLPKQMNQWNTSA